MTSLMPGGRRMSLVQGVIAIAIAALFASSSAGADEPQSIDFATYLTSFDLVIEGTVTAVDTVFRARLGGCGVAMTGAMKSWDIHVHVSRVVQGTAEDSTVVLTTLGRGQFPGAGLHPGAHVIGWGFRNCADGWRLWGNVVLVNSKGLLVADLNNTGSLRLDGQLTSIPLRMSALDSALANREELSSVRAFNGKAGVALLRVSSIVAGPNGTYSMACDSVAVLLGGNRHLPQFVDITIQPPCTRELEVGDSLVVAIPESFSGDHLVWTGCAGSLVVKNRFVRGFGVPLEFLPYALRSQEDGVRVRPFISRD